MMRITGIEEQKGNKKRVNVFLDGRFAFSLNGVYALEKGLKIGVLLSQAEVDALLDTDNFLQAYETAIRYLSYRPRSEAEVRRRLRQGRFADVQIEKVLSRLRDLKAVDDTSFAQFWTENRQTFRPRGRRLIQLELRQKGVDSEAIEEALSDVDEEENAFKAAERRVRTIQASDYEAFRDRLGPYLQRRGFSYDVIREVISRLWEENKPK